MGKMNLENFAQTQQEKTKAYGISRVSLNKKKIKTDAVQIMLIDTRLYLQHFELQNLTTIERLELLFSCTCQDIENEDMNNAAQIQHPSLLRTFIPYISQD